jgi:hypothetical protein
VVFKLQLLLCHRAGQWRPARIDVSVLFFVL